MSFYCFTSFEPMTGSIPDHDFGLTKHFASHARCFLGFSNRSDATVHAWAELMGQHLSKVDEPLFIGHQNTRFRQLLYASQEMVDKYGQEYADFKEYELYATMQLLQVHEIVQILGDEEYDRFFAEGTMAHVLPEFIARMSELMFIMQKLYIGNVSAHFASKATNSAMILSKRIQAQAGAEKRHKKDKEAKDFVIAKYYEAIYAHSVDKEKWQKSLIQAVRDLSKRYQAQLKDHKERTIYDWLREEIKSREPSTGK